jgi:hypothetical protein
VPPCFQSSNRRACNAQKDPSANDRHACDYAAAFFGREAWRFVEAQQAVTNLAMTAVEYRPMQDPASFNLEAVMKQIEEMIRAHHGG